MEVPPDVLKFDIGLVRGISSKPQRVQTMVADLVRMAAGMGVRTLAEGIEAQEDSDFCEAAGFDLIQGYLYGRPTPDPLPPGALVPAPATILRVNLPTPGLLRGSF